VAGKPACAREELTYAFSCLRLRRHDGGRRWPGLPPGLGLAGCRKLKEAGCHGQIAQPVGPDARLSSVLFVGLRNLPCHFRSAPGRKAWQSLELEGKAGGDDAEAPCLKKQLCQLGVYQGAPAARATARPHSGQRRKR